jgi:hypothetical protein
MQREEMHFLGFITEWPSDALPFIASIGKIFGIFNSCALVVFSKKAREELGRG